LGNPLHGRKSKANPHPNHAKDSAFKSGIVKTSV
jgi:hypothetical protein